jgi:hypothetical protein
MSDQFDQTSFAGEQPIREDGITPHQPHVQQTVEVPLVPKKPMDKKVMLIIGLSIFTLLSFLLLALINPKPPGTPQVNTTPSPTPLLETGPTTKLGQEIKELQDNIKSADPLQNELPFPPLNFHLHLKIPNSN